jgi:hypothetical protein
VARNREAPEVVMKNLVTILAVATLGSISSGIGPVSAGNVQKLSGAQIRAKFNGMQLTDEVHYRDVYERDGTLRSYAMGTAKTGRWVVEKDQLCLYFKEPDDGCYDVSRAGDRIEMTPAGLGLSIEGILQIPTDRD